MKTSKQREILALIDYLIEHCPVSAAEEAIDMVLKITGTTNANVEKWRKELGFDE